MATGEVKMFRRAILLVIIAGLYATKGEPGKCRPVNLHISLSGDANNLRSASKAVLDVTGILPTDSNLAVVAQGSSIKHIFNGTAPVEMDKLEKILEEHRQSDFPTSNMLHGQQFLTSMNQTWDTGTTAAKLSLVITSGGFDCTKAWEIRETAIVTVLQLNQGDHSQSWSGITADDGHYLRVYKNGSVPTQELNNLICRDSDMVCGTSKFKEPDLKTYRCDDCRSICYIDYRDDYCNETCPYFKSAPLLEPTPLSTSNETHQHDFTTTVAWCIGAVCMFIALLVSAIALWKVKKLRRSRRRSRQEQHDFNWHMDTEKESVPDSGGAVELTEIKRPVVSEPADRPATGEREPMLPQPDTSPTCADQANSYIPGARQNQSRSSSENEERFVTEREMDINADTFNGPMHSIR